eukprot:RCo021873
MLGCGGTRNGIERSISAKTNDAKTPRTEKDILNPTPLRSKEEQRQKAQPSLTNHGLPSLPTSPQTHHTVGTLQKPLDKQNASYPTQQRQVNERLFFFGRVSRDQRKRKRTHKPAPFPSPAEWHAGWDEVAAKKA